MNKFEREPLPDITEFFFISAKIERFSIWDNLCNEMSKKFDVLEDKKKKFISFKSPIFKNLIDEYKKQYQISDIEIESVFSKVSRQKSQDENFFVFKIKSIESNDDGNCEIFCYFGKEEFHFVHAPSETELFYLNRHYIIASYCRFYCDKIAISMISTAL